MKLFNRTTTDDPFDLRRVTGSPGGTLDAGPAAPDAAPATPAAPADGATPVPSRLQRLAAAVDGVRHGRNDRSLRKIMQQLGMLTIGFGFVCILLGWYGASHSPYLYQEIPYLISGGLLGVALVVGGGTLVRSAWNLRQVEEDRRNALAIVRSVDRLERILRSLSEERTDQQLQEQS
jgi:hypothetical protein